MYVFFLNVKLLKINEKYAIPRENKKTFLSLYIYEYPTNDNALNEEI